MKNDPRISVIIPVFNTEKYLRDCLSSVQKQTISDFEVLIINDQTPDNSMSIAQEFSKADSRFLIIEHDMNKGLGGARNTGIEAAKGQYLFFLDSDDLIPIDALELLWDASVFGKNDMVIGNMAWYGQHRLSPVTYIDEQIKLWQKFNTDNLRGLPDTNLFTGSAVNRLYKRDLIINNGIRFPENLYYEDIPFSTEVWFFSKKIQSTQNIVYFRTRRQDANNPSITQTYNRKSYFDRDKIAQLIFNFSMNVPNSKKLGVTTLLRLVGTSKEMLNYAPVDIQHEILVNWFPKHLFHVNKMIDTLNKVQDESLKHL